jgi:hypothetical protein
VNGQSTEPQASGARSGKVAGVVRVARAGTTVDMGPPLGRETSAHDGLVVDYFMGTAWLAADSGALDTVQAVIDSGNVDPVSLSTSVFAAVSPGCR